MDNQETESMGSIAEQAASEIYNVDPADIKDRLPASKRQELEAKAQRLEQELESSLRRFAEERRQVN